MWRTVKLGDVCLVRRGTTITKNQTIDGNIPVIGGGTKPTYYHNEANRAPNCITVSGSGASAGFVNKWNEKIFASDCSTVEPKDDNQLPQFIYYYLLSQQQFIYENFRSGAAQPHVYAKDIAKLPFPIVPLAEQQRIVAKLDGAFAEIDRAIELSVLKAQHTSSLCKRLIDTKILDTPYGAKKLCDILEVKHGFAFKSEFFGDTGDKVLLTPGNFEESGGYRERGIKQKYYLGEFPIQFLLKGGELLLAMTEQAKGLLGSPIIVPLEGKYLHNQRLGKVVPKQSISMEWLFHYFNTSEVREELHRTGTGLKVRHTSPEKICNLHIRVPPLEEQVKIAQNLDALISEYREINNVLDKKVGVLQQLKTSVLTQELQPSEAA